MPAVVTLLLTAGAMAAAMGGAGVPAAGASSPSITNLRTHPVRAEHAITGWSVCRSESTSRTRMPPVIGRETLPRNRGAC